MEEKLSIKNELPIGFGLMLAANTRAMDNFSAMTDEEKRRVLETSRTKETKQDMERFVEELGNLKDGKESWF